MNLSALPACAEEAFDRRYRDDRDPWNFESSAYEVGRYEVMLRALRKQRYQFAFEPGCSIGAFTARLAGRCDRILATDISAVALAHAMRRHADLPNVRFEQMDLASHRPSGPYDLIVFSEIGYYFDKPQLGAIAGALAELLDVGGDFVAVHWAGESPDHVLHADEVHEILRSTLPLTCLSCERHPGFLLEVWSSPA